MTTPTSFSSRGRGKSSASSDLKVVDEVVETVPLEKRVQSVMTNLSVVNSILKSSSAQQMFRGVAGVFLKDSLAIKQANNTAISTSLSNAGGVIGWVMKSKIVSDGVSLLDTAIDSGYVTPEMITEIIDNPSLLKEIVNQFNLSK